MVMSTPESIETEINALQLKDKRLNFKQNERSSAKMQLTQFHEKINKTEVQTVSKIFVSKCL